MATPQDIDDQRSRLAQHRQNVQILLQQIAMQGGSMHAPLGLLNTLTENRTQIARCKTVLRNWGQQVEDHPDDSVAEALVSLDRQIGELEASLRLPLSAAVRTSVAQSLQEAQERRAALAPPRSTGAAGETVARFFGTVSRFFGRTLPMSERSKATNVDNVPASSGNQENDTIYRGESANRSYSSLNDWKSYAFVDHDLLFGVNDALMILGEQLVNPDANWIISIFGEGGIGKTALAYELVRQYYAHSGFTRIAWVSAKPIYIDSVGKVVKEKDVAYFWNDLIIEIVDRLHLDIPTSPSTWELEFPRKMRNISNEEKCLIVIDNLETIYDARETIKYLEKYKVINPHKVIITSRMSVHSYSRQAKEYQIAGLSSEDARAFIRHLGKGDSNISTSSNSDLDEILEITEGNPFLIKLVTRLFTVRRQPFSAVVADLKSKKADLGHHVAEYLYAQSIMELQKQVGKEFAVKILNVFCSKVPGESVDYDEFYQRSRIDDKDTFEQARQIACNLSIIRAIDGNRRFTIHSLLREYICT